MLAPGPKAHGPSAQKRLLSAALRKDVVTLKTAPRGSLRKKTACSKGTGLSAVRVGSCHTGCPNVLKNAIARYVLSRFCTLLRKVRTSAFKNAIAPYVLSRFCTRLRKARTSAFENAIAR